MGFTLGCKKKICPNKTHRTIYFWLRIVISELNKVPMLLLGSRKRAFTVSVSFPRVHRRRDSSCDSWLVINIWELYELVVFDLKMMARWSYNVSRKSFIVLSMPLASLNRGRGFAVDPPLILENIRTRSAGVLAVVQFSTRARYTATSVVPSS